MKTIYKFKINHVGLGNVEMPTGAKVISAKMIHGDMFIWAEVSPKETFKELPVLVSGTGIESDLSGLNFVDTVIDGAFVWHVYIGSENES